ncbi:unannotated protein [freshwater metagenome]|uniref:Unannotated protein n=1 Tax=freshwater metagenome TaxID=449393 RepID=A0A6J7I5B0_9ZZZZ|nr:hypothetical protein [Actinomycetota bacterium]
MSKGDAAILVVGFVHILGAILLISMCMNAGEGRVDPLAWWREDDDPGRGPEPPAAPSAGPVGSVPLPDADPAALRLRGPGRLADAHPRPPRRPDHAPDPRPARTPDRG